MAYLSSGEIVHVIGTVNGQTLVQVQGYAYNEEGEEYVVDGPLRLVDEVLEAPPVERLDAEIKEKREVLARINDALCEAKKSLQAAESEHKARLKKLQQHEALKRIDEWMEAKITHYAVIGGSILSISDGKLSREDAHYDPETHRTYDTALLTLYGMSNGCLSWRLSSYSSGGGQEKTVYPCGSLEEARTKLQEYLDARWPSEKVPYRLADLFRSAKALGLRIDAEFEGRVLENEIASARSVAAAKRRELDEAEKALAALEGTPCA